MNWFPEAFLGVLLVNQMDHAEVCKLILQIVCLLPLWLTRSRIFFSLQKNGAEFTWRTNLVCPPPEEQCSYSDGSNLYDLRLLTSRTRSWQYEHNGDRYLVIIDPSPKWRPKIQIS